jgi:hypothetical protein
MCAAGCPLHLLLLHHALADQQYDPEGQAITTRRGAHEPSDRSVPANLNGRVFCVPGSVRRAIGSVSHATHFEWLAILDDKHPVVDLAHSLCLPRGELKEKVSSMVAERFQKHSGLKTEAQKMLNSYLAASALYGEWRWEPAIGLRRTKRFGSPG